MHPGIKLRHLRVFLDITTEGSLTAAARRQRITQPAASRSLAELESLLGQPLFDRAGRELALTEAGEIFLRHIRAGMHSLEAAADAIGAQGSHDRLRVGVLPTAMAQLFPVAALRFHTQRPETLLSVLSGPQGYLIGLLHDGQIDLIIGRMPAPGEMADLRFDHLYDEPVVMVARAGHPMAGQPVRHMLESVPVILPSEGALIRGMVDAYLASIGLPGLRPAFETTTLTLGRALLRESDAVWFISQGVVAQDLRDGTLISVPLDAPYLSGAVGATRRAHDAERHDLDLLCQMLRREAGATP